MRYAPVRSNSLSALADDASLVASADEAVRAYTKALAANPDKAAQFADSTKFVKYVAGNLLRTARVRISRGMALTEEEAKTLANAITEINTSRYALEGRGGGMPWLTVLALGGVAAAFWYFNREKNTL